MSGSKFKKLLIAQKTLYTTWVPLYSIALRADVHFTSPGFNHLRFKIDNTPRQPAEAMYKLKLVTFVPLVIGTADSVDMYIRRLSPVGGSRTKVYKEMEYWSLVASIGDPKVKIRVILRRVKGSQKICFWSVMRLNNSIIKKPHRLNEAD